MNKIYLAIPYSHDDEGIMQRRFEFVTRYAAQLASDNTVPFSPITHSHEMARQGNLPRTWDFWETQDLPFLDWADELRIIDAEGYNESTGVSSEEEYWMDQNGDFPKHIDPLDTDAMSIVGISGRKRSGKDTAADILCEEYGYEKYSFADPIKAACKEVFGFDNEQVRGSRKENTDPYWGFSPRDAMQVFGTDAFRERKFWRKRVDSSPISTASPMATQKSGHSRRSVSK